jgi:predicted AlkP superfamily phosphohydrolase/phosphomutase
MATAIVFATLIGVSSCTRDVPAPRVVVLGVDGLDINLLGKLVAAGALPNFQRLYREGAVGRMTTFETGLPPLSPRIWSSAATGQLPAVHGLTTFVHEDEDGVRRLFTSSERRSPAAWEIATAAGKRIGVVNWWFTYPAETVNGFVISDRFLENWARRSAKYYRGELEREYDKLVYPPALADALGYTDDEAQMAAHNPQAAEDIDRRILQLAYTGLEQYEVDLLLIYTRALDELSHQKWHTHARIPGEKKRPDEIVDYMQRYDRLLGEFLARLDPHDHLMILSDHGFERTPEGKYPPGTHLSKASAHGTLILHGPRIRRGVHLDDVSVLDALPTMLELAGIPPATDMPGQVMRQALAEPERPLLTRVAPYERRVTGDETAAGATDADGETIHRLKTLGYIE